jgi:hypothetical protein
MNTFKIKQVIPALAVAATILISVPGFSQKQKIRDGSVIHQGRDRGTNRDKGRVSLPDGTIVLPGGTRNPDGSTRYPAEGRGRSGDGKRVPPGQAKKMYGGSARDYAPGQQRKWKQRNDDWRNDNAANNSGKSGKGKGRKG